MTTQLFNTAHFVQAMRDNGYKNAAYALAELMDNSIQAGASQVELLCGEKEFIDQRRRMRIDQIAVLDNGAGMNAEVMKVALQFGNGTHLKASEQTGMGRFGMGLPSASISQCKRVDVWSWQNGVDSALHTYLDLDKITSREQRGIPEPVQSEIPDVWRKVGTSWGKSGTLVVWSKIDRAMWRTAQAVITNSEFIIGRMYRKFIESKSVAIRLVQFDIEQPMPTAKDKLAQPNDPGYLMERTSCPAPFNDQAMFEVWGHESTYEVNFEGGNHLIKMEFSMAKREARENSPGGKVAGSLPHGAHAGRNIGTSVVRAGRELDLSQVWVLSEQTERWWGVKIEFPPALDKLFGVTNNKQSAHSFTDLGTIDFDEELKGGKTITALRDEMLEDGDPRAPLMDIAHHILSNIREMRRRLKEYTAGSRTKGGRHPGIIPEVIATTVTKEMQEEGYEGVSDKDEGLPDEQRQLLIENALIAEGVDEVKAHEFAATLVSDGRKYGFETTHLETAAFFSVKTKGGSIVILLNMNHPAYTHLIEVLEDDTEGVSPEQLQYRLNRAADGLKLLLMAWARYEDGLDGKRREAAQDARTDWGRIARRFLSHDE